MATGRQPNGILYDGRFLWGKYKGRAVQDAPDDYLQFLIAGSQANIETLQAELDRRAQVAQASQSWAQKIVEAGFRALARQHHPDLGGDGSAMREINNAVEALREVVREDRP